ncbi:Hypothetical protein CM240_1623 [Clostridium bornimense]|uniref:Uncharacterized protein n=1 Tax=Clostridium bornimense TaxID=1216932 RepID=W6RVQ1_9CLOT|nr:hypothetical protein [Clostridium bornimense]CDM68781.1 Hypothetical protein CM240_1623 [Clostridium bornimense]
MIIYILIVTIGILLIWINRKEFKVKSSGFKEVLINKTDTITEVEIEIQNLRRDFAETIGILQMDIKNLSEDIDNLKGTQVIEESIIENDFSNSGKSNNVEEVKRLIEQDVSIDDICKILSIGKGEVLLIKDLYKQ